MASILDWVPSTFTFLFDGWEGVVNPWNMSTENDKIDDTASQPDGAAGERADADDTEVLDPDEVGIELAEEEDELSELSARLQVTEARLRTVSAAYKGLQEDMTSFQKRVERQQELKLEVHKGETVAKLFGPVEDLRRAIDAATRAGADKAQVEGLEMVFREFMEAFGKLGLTEVAQQGAGFDPLFHEVLSVIPIPDPSMDGRILEIFAQGYKVGSRLIRPAKVVVAQAPPAPTASEE